MGDFVSRTAFFRETGDEGWNPGAPGKFGRSGNPTSIAAEPPGEYYCWFYTKLHRAKSFEMCFIGGIGIRQQSGDNEWLGSTFSRALLSGHSRSNDIAEVWRLAVYRSSATHTLKGMGADRAGIRSNVDWGRRGLNCLRLWLRRLDEQLSGLHTTSSFLALRRCIAVAKASVSTNKW